MKHIYYFIAGLAGFITCQRPILAPANVRLKVCCLFLWLLMALPQLLVAQSPTPSGTVVAGGNGAGSAANQLYFPRGVFVDASGNVYVADQYNHRIQKWAVGATQGVTAAGGKYGFAANQLNSPYGVYVDASGNVYVADYDNHRIQKWAVGATQGVTVAGENVFEGSSANQLYLPSGVFVDERGNVYVADNGNHRIQKWAPGATQGATVAGGNGQGSAANQLSRPYSIYVDASGNVYVSDYDNHRIQKWAPGATQGVTVAGGNGQGSAANQLSFQEGVYVDLDGNVYVADHFNHRIQKWAPGATQGVTVAGGNGAGSAANQLDFPSGVFVDERGNVYVADIINERVMKFPPVTNTVIQDPRPILSVFPTTPKLGSLMTVSGSGFTPASSVTITLTKDPAGVAFTPQTVQTNASGGFAGVTFTPTEFGNYEIKGTDAQRVTATLLFNPLDSGNPISIIKPFNGDRLPQLTTSGPYSVTLVWNDKISLSNSQAAGNTRSVPYIINYKLATASTWSSDVVVTKSLNVGNQKEISAVLALPALGTYSFRIKHQLASESFKQLDNITVEKLIGTNYTVTLQNSRFTTPIKGLVTDGVSRVKLKYAIEPSSYPIKRINVSLSDPVANKKSKELLGTLVSAQGIADNVADNSAFSPAFAQSFTILAAANTYNFDFWYLAPTDFSDGTAYVTDATRKVKVTFEVIYSKNGTEVAELNSYDILLARPPLMLVHGLALTKDQTWGPLITYFQNTSPLYLYDLNRSNAAINPGGDGFGTISSFTDNAQNLLFGNATYGSTTFKSVVKIMTDLGFVCHRVDLLGHGMAANVAHAAVIYQGGKPYFSQSDTYGAGYVNKFINLNAQKNGSPLIDIIEFLLQEINHDLITEDDIKSVTSFVKDFVAATPTVRKSMREGIINGTIWKGKLLSRLATRYLAYYILADWEVPYLKHFIRRVPRAGVTIRSEVVKEFMDVLKDGDELKDWFELFYSAGKFYNNRWEVFNSFLKRDVLVLSEAANELRNNETNFYNADPNLNRTLLTPVNVPKSGIHYLVGDLVGGDQVNLLGATDWILKKQDLLNDSETILEKLSSVVEKLDDLSDYSYIGSKAAYQLMRNELKNRQGTTKDREKLYQKWYRANRIPYIQDQKTIESISKALGVVDKLLELLKLVGQSTQIADFVFNSDGVASTGSQAAANTITDLTAPYITKFPETFTPLEPLKGVIEYNYFSFMKQYGVMLRVKDLLNSSLSSSVFTRTMVQPTFAPSGINPLMTKAGSITSVSSTFVKTLTDTTRMKIISPLAGSIQFVNATVKVSVALKDTARFSRLEVVFQGKSYYQTERASTYAFNLPVNPAESSEIIVANALYDYSQDSSLIIKDRVLVTINSTETLQRIEPVEEVITVKKGDEFGQNALLTYTTYDVTVLVDKGLSVFVADTNIVRFDTLRSVLVAKKQGTTNVKLAYKGKQAEFIILVEEIPQNIVAYPQTEGVCPGGILQINLSKEGYFDPATTFYVELSNAQGAFTNPILLASGQNLNAVSTTLSAGLSPGSAYRIRVRTDIQSYTSTNNQALTLYSAPTATLTGTQTITSGQTATLTATLTGSSPWSFTLSNGQAFSGVVALPFAFTVAPANTTTYTLARVANACGTGTVSGTAVVTVQSSNTCSAPASLTETDQAFEYIKLNWTTVAGATGYQVRWKESTFTTWNSFTTCCPGYYLSSLTYGKTYNWQVATICPNLPASTFSAIRDFTLSCPMPFLLNELVNGNNVRLYWANMRYQGTPACFTVRWRPVGSTTWETRTVCSDNTSLLNLLAATNYEWQISTTCPGGTSSAFTSSRVFTTGTCGAPRVYGWNPGATSTRLWWTTIATSDVFEIQWRPSSATTAYNSLTTTGGFVGSNSLTGLSPNTNYELRVRAFCGNGLTSAFSDLVTFTTQATCQPATANLTTFGSSTITAGQATTLSVYSTGDTPISFTLSNGQVFTGITTYYYNFTVAPANTTTYTLSRVANACGTGTVSGSATVTVISCNSMYTVRTGNWNDPGTWSCNRVPVSTDVVKVSSGHTVTIPAGSTALALTLQDYGRLVYGTGARLRLGATTDLTTGLVGWYPFNGNANDASGNSNHGTVSGAALVAGRNGTANSGYRFSDGNSINVASSASLQFTNAQTFAGWVKLRSYAGRDGNGALVAKGVHTVFSRYCDLGHQVCRFDIDAQNNINFSIVTGSTFHTVNFSYTLDTWVHIASVYDGTTLRLYVNGVLAGSKTTTLTFGVSNISVLNIGKMGCYYYFFNGDLDELRFYNRAMTDAEVQALAAQ